ncbi:NAD-binding protein [Thermostichus vulcanus]|uniref:NAD-binding protein n=1 Tax=Thermostichus vulcanus str. 'Rupite' TaxID=2813851 RepID=A0ABT0CBP1_THEVL|nr:NAD-binding protein [Thermostichus vulcanus]MCJ2543219.1 NAD-binding protein [Thermostichus vulcanus str. 'Rupite']
MARSLSDLPQLQPQDDGRDPEAAILVCGYNDLVELTLQALEAFGQRALVVDPQPLPTPIHRWRQLRGDPRQREVLQRAGIERVKVVLLLQDDDQANFELALLIRDLNPQVRIISRLFNRSIASYLDSVLPQHFSLSVAALAAPAFALKAVSDEFVGYFELPQLDWQKAILPSELADPLSLTPPQETTLWNVVDLTIEDNSRLLHMPLSELEETFGARVLFHYPVDGLSDFSEYRVFDDFDHEAELIEGDRILVICDPKAYLQLLERNGRRGSSRAQRWASGQVEDKRQWRQTPWQWGSLLVKTRQALLSRLRTGLKGLLQIKPIVRTLTLTLGAMLVLGVINFQVIGKSVIDGLLLTIVVLTGGYGDIDDFQQPETPLPVKVLAVFMTLVGAALVGLVYGLVTDKLVSSRFGLGQAARMPKQDHVVIAGLGRLSYLVLQLLRQMGYEVVVLEPETQNPLLEAARREGAVVIQGNYALAGTLKQAHIEGSRCLICTTPNDLTNLETALTAHTLHPGIRTILRVADPELAERMQRHIQTLGISYSATGLVAPAFATAALVGSVYGTLAWEGETLLVTLLEVSAQTHYLGLSLRQLAHDYDLVILWYQATRGKPEIFPKLWQKAGEQVLKEGDRLYVMGAVGSLIRLAQQRPFPPELYQVQLLEYHNPYFEDEILSALSFYAQVPKAALRSLLHHLPIPVSPPLPRDKAIKLARQLRKMSTEVQMLAQVQEMADPVPKPA